MAQAADATNDMYSMVYPFLVIEFKGKGEDLSAATNQCLGGSAACLKIIEGLNDRLHGPKMGNVERSVFSIAMNGSEARLYVSWKDQQMYRTASARNFLLSDPDHHLDFRRHVRNILDWGMDRRLKAIQGCLDMLMEEHRENASKEAKARPPPSSASATSSDKRQKSSASTGDKSAAES
jgi:hypothetical protein